MNIEQSSEFTDVNQMSIESKARIVAGGAKTIFVVFGRNQMAKDAMMNYLYALGVNAEELRTVPFDEASEGIETLLDKAFKRAKGVLVLLTPDDDGNLREWWADPYDKNQDLHIPMFQPRMNVIFEIGLAWGKGHKENTILVEMNNPEGKRLRMPSDISENRFKVRMYDSGSVQRGLSDIKVRLETKVLRCKLNQIDPDRQKAFENDFLRAIQEGKEPAGITGLDQDRWVARTVSGVPQGVDFRRVDLGGPFKTLRFSVASDSPYWRGGVKLEETGSPATVPELIHEKSLLFHLGGKDRRYGATGYYDSSWADLRGRKKTYFVNEVLGKVDRTPIRIELAMHKQGNKNLLFCKVIEENRAWQPKPPVVIPKDLDLLSNVYFVAWGDSETVDGEEVLRDYEVEFSILDYELWNE